MARYGEYPVVWDEIAKEYMQMDDVLRWQEQFKLSEKLPIKTYAPYV